MRQTNWSALIFVLLSLVFAVHGLCTTSAGSTGVLRAEETGNEIVLPLKETDVRLEITANLVYAEVRQVFFNDSNHILEAFYSFPLPSGATITHMELVYPDRRIRSVVQEREAARRTYVTAKNQGKRTALLEQQRPNLFTTSVANFQPGEEVEIVFSYVEQLPFNGPVYEVTFPMTFGPRYFPREEQQTVYNFASLGDVGRLSPPVSEVFTDHLVRLGVTVTGLPIRDIWSNTHPIMVEETGFDVFRVELAESEVLPDRDFSLKMELWEEESPQVSFLQSEGPTGVHGLLTVYPPLEENTRLSIPSREVIFLIDTSGSMGGDPMSQAQEGLRECLAMLHPGDRFNIVRFSHNYSSLSPSFLDFNENNEDAAFDYIASMRAGGGTEMQQALDYVLSLPGEPGFMRMVVFLTDGDVGNEVSLTRLVDNKVGAARIFSFGVGSAPNEYLIRALSERGHGVANFLKSEDDISEVMTGFFETVNTPVLTDVEVIWKPRDGQEMASPLTYPQVAPDVFMYRPLQLCFRYPTYFQGEIEVRGTVNGSQVSYDYPVGHGPNRNFPSIDTLFGRARINEQMVAWIQSQNHEAREQRRLDIVETALAYQLVTQFTSRVAVEERTIRGPDQKLVSTKVPVMSKYGTTQGFAATATTDYLYLLWGGLSPAALSTLPIGPFLAELAGVQLNPVTPGYRHTIPVPIQPRRNPGTAVTSLGFHYLF